MIIMLSRPIIVIENWYFALHSHVLRLGLGSAQSVPEDIAMRSQMLVTRHELRDNGLIEVSMTGCDKDGKRIGLSTLYHTVSKADAEYLPIGAIKFMELSDLPISNYERK